MRRAFFATALVVAGCIVADAQIAVTDPAVTLRNSVSAALHEYVVNTQQEQRRQLRRMSRRLSVFTNLDKYALPEPPQWRIHLFDDPGMAMFAADYQAALNYGDVSGRAYLGVTVPLVDPHGFMDEERDLASLRDFASRLATINVADATAISAANDTGHTRYNGRRELDAISQLESDVLDPSQEQSTTAVLDKVSGAVLIGARQRQARAQLLVGFVEQLLVDSKRARDTEATVMNMQLATWVHGQAANHAFVAGTGDALRGWKQP
jgi:hypothetical protein